jgi:hypothetical protein
MPEPSSDSITGGSTVTTATGAQAEVARKNMPLRGPSRSALDSVNKKQGGFGGPAPEMIDLPKG